MTWLSVNWPWLALLAFGIAVVAVGLVIAHRPRKEMPRRPLTMAQLYEQWLRDGTDGDDYDGPQDIDYNAVDYRERQEQYRRMK